jgi:hypothetical protein
MPASYSKCPHCKNRGTGTWIYICKSCGEIAGCAIWIDKGPLGLFGHQEGCLRNQTCNNCRARDNYEFIGKIS